MSQSRSLGKPFEISKWAVHEAYCRVKANKGAAGVDEVSIEAFEADLKNNLYKVWNRMASGTYFPPPVRAVALFRCFKSCRFHPGSSALPELLEKNQLFVIAVLITIPVIFLFVYDPAHAYYRNYYLDHFASVAACLIFASLSGRVAIRVTKVVCAIIGIAAGASLILNAFLFVPPLWDGYEGPSLSVFRSWSQAAHDTNEAARLCKMDLQRGRIIVDDLTQAGVFSRPVTIPVTYLNGQAYYIGMSVHDAAISVKANYAILECPYFDLFGVCAAGQSWENLLFHL
jgi:hypothetical protein